MLRKNQLLQVQSIPFRKGIDLSDTPEGKRRDLEITYCICVCSIHFTDWLTDFKYVYLCLAYMTLDFEKVGMCQPAAN